MEGKRDKVKERKNKQTEKTNIGTADVFSEVVVDKESVLVDGVLCGRDAPAQVHPRHALRYRLEVKHIPWSEDENEIISMSYIKFIRSISSLRNGKEFIPQIER